MVFLCFCCISFIRVWCFPALAACLRCMVPARQVLAVKMKSEKRVKHHMVFLLFYCISCRCRLLEGFGFGFVFCLSFSCRLLEGFGCGGEFTQKKLRIDVLESSRCENQLTKKGKTPHGFLLFFCISFGCRLLEDFGFGFVFCFSFSCRLLEGSGCGDECAKTT